ncbi:MAG: ATP-grasp fold amidoligase family protein [Pseudomonadota bacterium]
MEERSDLPAIGTLWLEGPLSYLEQVSLISMIATGHRVTLFHHRKISNVPEGVHTCPVQEIHEPLHVFPGIAPQSQQAYLEDFRLELLCKTSLLWCDIDLLSLAPLPNDPYVFGQMDPETLGTAVLRLPRQSQALEDYLAFRRSRQRIPTTGDEARKGPRNLASAQSSACTTLTNFLKHSGEIAHASDISVFYPLPREHVHDVSSGSARALRDTYFTDKTLAVYLWNQDLRDWLRDSGISRHSLLDRRLRWLGVNPSKAPIVPVRWAPIAQPIDPAPLPKLRIGAKTRCEAAVENVDLGAVATSEQTLQLAQAHLDDIVAKKHHRVSAYVRKGYVRGWDYFETEAKRLYALGALLSSYLDTHERMPNVFDPQTFTEKLLVMRMFAEIPIPAPTDRLRAESFIPAKARKMLAPVRRYWSSNKDPLPRDPSLLTGTYWLKDNSHQGHGVCVRLPFTDEDHETTNARLDNWRRSPAFDSIWTSDWWSSTIDRTFLLEEDLSKSGQEITSWIFWVIAGQVALVLSQGNGDPTHARQIYDRNFKAIPCAGAPLADKCEETDMMKPMRFDDMVTVAEATGQKLEFACVELLSVGSDICLGQITLSPIGGVEEIRTSELDRRLGDAWIGTRLFPQQ